MRLTALSADGFKNLRQVQLEPDPSYNVIYGENAQGKTNLLEAIWILTGCRSFRGSRERDYLPFGGGSLEIQAKFQDLRREQVIRFAMRGGSTPEKRFWRNEIPQKSSALFSVFHCVVFTPEDLALVSGGPERRRSFLDLCSAQLHAPMLALVRRYQLALQQRNAVLRQKLAPAAAEPLLQVWDRQLVQLGTEIALQRARYVRRLAAVCVPLYSQIARGKETVSLQYHANVFGREAEKTLPENDPAGLAAQYQEKLQQSRQTDFLLGHTSAGIHRDDLQLLIDGKSAREFGSQGQKKSLALALKLAQAEIYSQRRKEPPVILLDDVMGELDESRQQVVSTMVEGMQVFVTTCHPESLLTPDGGKQFLLKGGILEKM